MTDLNNLVSLPTGWTLLTRATAINENGDIAGVGLVDGVEHGFILTTGAISAPPPAQNQPPVAVINADVTSGKAALVVNFDSSASTDHTQQLYIAPLNWLLIILWEASFSVN